MWWCERPCCACSQYAAGARRSGREFNCDRDLDDPHADVALDPDYASNQRIYLSFSERDAVDATIDGTTVARARLDPIGLKLTEIQITYRQSPKMPSGGHYRSRLVFDKNGYLVVTMGERFQGVFSQDLSKGNGKVVPITTQGAAAPGNRLASHATAQPEIWSYGHRNPQGAAQHPVTGALWVSEHGPQGGDELNLVQAGKNYGWPVISWGQEYGTTTQIGEGTTKPGMEQPVSYWIPRDGTAYTAGAKSSIAPSGLAIYSADKFPEYRGNVLMGALAAAALWRVVLAADDGKTEVFRERLLAARNERLRDVRVGPDGWIYLLTDGENAKLLKISRQR